MRLGLAGMSENLPGAVKVGLLLLSWGRLLVSICSVPSLEGHLPSDLDLLLFLLLYWLEGYRGVDLGCLHLQEQVHLVIGLGDHLGGPRAAPLISSGGLLLYGGLQQGGPVVGGQVCQLEFHLGVLDD